MDALEWEWDAYIEAAHKMDAHDVLFAKTVARNALTHADWGFDQHIRALVKAGFAREYIMRHSRSIAEAMFHRREMERSR
jgi:hypothetical protein